MEDILHKIWPFKAEGDYSGHDLKVIWDDFHEDWEVWFLLLSDVHKQNASKEKYKYEQKRHDS